MKIIYTKHAEEKFRDERFIPQLKITKRSVKRIIDSPDILRRQAERFVAIGNIDREHSFVIIYKKVKRAIKIITFWPAKKGRYETKVL